MNAPLDPEDQPSPPLAVLKFGGSVLHGPEDFGRLAHEVYRQVREGRKVLAILSAQRGETDQLLKLGTKVGANLSIAPQNAARLARCGELKAAALAGLALARAGFEAEVVDPHEIGLRAEGEPLDADLAGLDAQAVRDRLQRADCLVLPGFIGQSEHGPATLGRGGSDLSAVRIAHWMGAAHVRLIKDVDGIYESDPKREPDARRYLRLNYAKAESLGRGVVQTKALRAAEALGLEIRVSALDGAPETRIAPGKPLLASPQRASAGRRLRVALLGHGAVGAGVRALIRAHPDRFELNPVLVRDPARHGGAGFTCDPAKAMSGPADVVIELMGGTGLARTLSENALRAGADLITANKALMASQHDDLHALAAKSERRIAYSAAVGGAVPMLEAADRAAADVGVLRIEGVLNGTCNFILSRMEDGADFQSALAEAQAMGFAEADPSADIDGPDAAEKLSLLIRHAFGLAVEPQAIPKESLRSLTPELVAAVRENGKRYKQIAYAEARPDGRIEARVALKPVPLDHPFAALDGAANGLALATPTDERRVTGQGAGRWPTAESVFADLIDIHRLRLGPEDAPAPSPNPLREANQDASPLQDGAA